MAKVIMVQGTMSNAGKSLIVAGLCRIFRQDGYRVAPFKSQNMALNSYITKDGKEMGRAQVMQAEAAGIEPDVCMNPILLKPTGDMGSQVIVNGEVMGNMKARDYFKYKRELIPDIVRAFKKLETIADIIVIEGAGSPAEINLKENDIVNMGMAEIVDAPVLLVGDIDRGGVFAQLLGTLMLLDEDEKARVEGLVINKFRGDKTILDPGVEMLEKLGGIPVVGVTPYMYLNIDDEDSLTERFISKKNDLSNNVNDDAGNNVINDAGNNVNNDAGNNVNNDVNNEAINIVVIRYPRISNFTDFNVFEQFDNVRIRYATKPAELESADLIILPGSKNTMGDLKWLEETGMSEAVLRMSESTPVFGICGGYQMLGECITDSDGIEEKGSLKGLGLLPVSTEIKQHKFTKQVEGIIGNVEGIFSGLSGKKYLGYEIHMGETKGNESLVNRDNVYGSYIHGLFDRAEIAEEIVRAVAVNKGLEAENIKAVDYDILKDREYDKLADNLRQHMDMKAIYSVLREVRYSDKCEKKPVNNTKVKIQFADVEKYLISEDEDRKKEYSKIAKEIKTGWDSVAKPLDSLGELERITAKIGAIQGTPYPKTDNKAIVVMCADNGVVDEKISQSGQEVTLAVAKSMAMNKSSVGKMSEVNNTKVIPIDIGINSDEIVEGVADKKVRKGTRNFALEPAMTPEETIKAIQTGMDTVLELKNRGYDILGIGEMGIGNTTTSTAVAASILGIPASEIVGRGAGLDDEGLKKKEKVIDDAIRKYNLYGKDALTVLTHVGGYDIAGLTGVIIGGALYHVPIVLDGIITAVAALVADRMFPQITDYIIPSHVGRERGMKLIYDDLNMDGIIHANLALGEGTGAALLFPLLDCVMNIYREQTTFEDIKVEAYRRFK
ncbi:MAG: cobyric acid synthase [Lachnospiraceae bacterium]|nr:cobyric acid synthase [Lachnospiraceae bacterium]